MNYTRYFIINLVVENFYDRLLKNERKLCYLIIEDRDAILGCFYYTYYCIQYRGVHIKKLLTKNKVLDILDSKKSINDLTSWTTSGPLTEEDMLLSFINNQISGLPSPTTTKSKLYSYNL